MTRVVIKDGRIVTAVDDYVADILIEDGRIRTIGLELPTDDAEVHRADGPLVLPGGVDVHTHLDYDTGAAHTADDFSTGTRAAAFGGTTTLLDFAPARWQRMTTGAAVPRPPASTSAPT